MIRVGFQQAVDLHDAVTVRVVVSVLPGQRPRGFHQRGLDVFDGLLCAVVHVTASQIGSCFEQVSEGRSDEDRRGARAVDEAPRVAVSVDHGHAGSGRHEFWLLVGVLSREQDWKREQPSVVVTNG